MIKQTILLLVLSFIIYQVYINFLKYDMSSNKSIKTNISISKSNDSNDISHNSRYISHLSNISNKMSNSSIISNYEFDNFYFTKNKENITFKLPFVPAFARWIDLYNGMHFDQGQNGIDDIRPPAIILFHGYKTCSDAEINFQFNNLAENHLPSIERLTIYKYDMDAAPLRLERFTPEMDLKSRFKVSECPTLVFVPKSCDGWTKWCTKKVFHKTLGNITQVGCDNYTESCINTKQYVFKEKGYNQTELINWIENEIGRAHV